METEAEKVVHECIAVRMAVGPVLSIELLETIDEESSLLYVMTDGDRSAQELIYWAATIFHPQVWHALAPERVFARIAFMPLQETFHGAETYYGAIVWASHADPGTLTELDLRTIRACYMQVCSCLSPVTWKLSATLNELGNRWNDARTQRLRCPAGDIYLASRFYDVLSNSAGQEIHGNDFGDAMIDFRIDNARSLFAQIAIHELLIRGISIRTWEHFLEPLFTRWFSERQSSYTAALIAEVADTLRGGEELPHSITSRYSESELTIARADVKLESLEENNE